MSYSHNSSRKVLPKPGFQLLFPSLEGVALGSCVAPTDWYLVANASDRHLQTSLLKASLCVEEKQIVLP